MIREPKNNRATQRLKGFSDHYLLALISTGGVYGFELIRAMEESTLTPQCSEGTIYGLLKRLESQGLVTSHEEIGMTNRRRRYYRILPEGETKLAEWNEQWSRFKEGMDSVVGEPEFQIRQSSG